MLSQEKSNEREEAGQSDLNRGLSLGASALPEQLQQQGGHQRAGRWAVSSGGLLQQVLLPV